MVSYVKYPDWIALVYAQLCHFIVEVEKEVPADSVCPCLHKHGKSIKQMKYENVDLVEGWLIVHDNEVVEDATQTRQPARGPKPISWKL